MRFSAGCPGIGARGQGDTERSCARGDALGRLLDVARATRRSARDRPRPCARRASPRGRAAAARPAMRDVVGDDHHLDVEAHRARLLRREAEVQAIARVVLHDEQAARVAGDGEDRREHGVDARRREDLAAHRGREQPVADEAGVRGLVPGAAARHDRDARPVPVGADHHLDRRVPVEARELALAQQDGGVDGLGDDIAAVVDEVLHGAAMLREPHDRPSAHRPRGDREERRDAGRVRRRLPSRRARATLRPAHARSRPTCATSASCCGRRSTTASRRDLDQVEVAERLPDGVDPRADRDRRRRRVRRARSRRSIATPRRTPRRSTPASRPSRCCPTSCRATSRRCSPASIASRW